MPKAFNTVGRIFPRSDKPAFVQQDFYIRALDFLHCNLEQLLLGKAQLDVGYRLFVYGVVAGAQQFPDIIDKKPITDVKLSFMEKQLLHTVMKKVKGTDVELLLKESGLIE